MSSSSVGKLVEKLEGIKERLARAERVNVKLEAKEKEKKFKFSKPGCEKQFRFNSKMKDLFGDDLKAELEVHFKKGLPKGVGVLVKEAEKEIDDRNLEIKVADEFGFKAMDGFTKEDLARDDKEEKKIKALRKEKREKEEKLKGGLRGGRVVSGRAWASGGGSKGAAKKGFGRKPAQWANGRDGHKAVRCFGCWGLGHMARDCVRPSGGRARK